MSGYNPNKDKVAERTASQIERAKRMAVGGRKKRCVKGKSCSATCIAANKVCMVEIPWVAAQGIPKIVAQIQKVATATKIVVKLRELTESEKLNVQLIESDFKKKITLTRKYGNFPAYDKARNEIISFNKQMKDKGINYTIEVPPSTKRIIQLGKAYEKRVAAILDRLRESNDKGDRKTFDKDKELLVKLYERLGKGLGKGNVAVLMEWKDKTPTGANNVSVGSKKLPALGSKDEFMRALKDTEYYNDSRAQKYHEKAGLIMDKDNSENDTKSTAMRGQIIDKMGSAKFNEAVKAVRNFTDDQYVAIRQAQHAAMKGGPIPGHLDHVLERAQNVEKFISLMPKEEIVKFRGIKTDKNTLNDMIESAKAKGDFKDGALASWSTSLSVARGFADTADADKSQRVIFRTVNKHGVGIDSVTSWTGEMEVLTPGTAKYAHTGNYRTIEVGPDTYHIFDVVER